EGPVLCCVHSSGRCRVRRVLRSVRTYGATGSDCHPDSSKTRLLFLVAVRAALALASFDGDAGAPRWPGHRDYWSAASSVSLRRRGKELAPKTNRCFNCVADRRYVGDIHTSCGIRTLEPAHERLER